MEPVMTSDTGRSSWERGYEQPKTTHRWEPVTTPRRPTLMRSTRARSLLIPLAAVLAVAVIVAGIWVVRRSADTPTAADDPPTSPATTTLDTLPTGTFRIDSYHLSDPSHLLLNYTTGVPACYGKVGVPQVVTDAGAVTVTLPRLGPAPHKGVACIDIVQVRSVAVTLQDDLGDRAVRDGSRGGAQVPRGTAPGGEQAR